MMTDRARTDVRSSDRSGWRRAARMLILTCVCLAVFAAASAEITVRTDRGTYAPWDTVLIGTEGAGENGTYKYDILLNGKRLFTSGKPDGHAAAGYVPVKEGQYTVEVTVTGAGGEKETVSAGFEVSGKRRAAEDDAVYSQKNGAWKTVPYRKSELDTSGCAIFTLSHALRRMGFTGQETEPETLASKYARCLVKGGTSNVMLITAAAKDFGFTTVSALMTDASAIRDALADGDAFSFSVARGHIALACGISEDGAKVLIADSAPSATLERIKNARMYRKNESGAFVPVKDLAEFPGAVWYPETGQYGGLEYYLDLSYVAGRGGRLMRPYHYYITETDGSRTPVEMVSFGSALCGIEKDGKTMTVPTADVQWRTEIGLRKVAVTTGKKSAQLKDAAGRRVGTVPPCSVTQVVREEKDGRLCVRWQGKRGILPAGAAEIYDITGDAVRTGTISVNGKTKGRAKVKMRLSPSGRIMDNWTVGTRVAVLGEEDGSWLVEGMGRRLWVRKEFVTPDGN